MHEHTTIYISHRVHPTQSIPVYVTAFVYMLPAVDLLMCVEPSRTQHIYDIYIKMCASSNANRYTHCTSIPKHIITLICAQTSTHEFLYISIQRNIVTEIVSEINTERLALQSLGISSYEGGKLTKKKDIDTRRKISTVPSPGNLSLQSGRLVF